MLIQLICQWLMIERGTKLWLRRVLWSCWYSWSFVNSLDMSGEWDEHKICGTIHAQRRVLQEGTEWKWVLNNLLISLRINETQQNETQHHNTQFKVSLCFVLVECGILSCYAERHFADCHNSYCHAGVILPIATILIVMLVVCWVSRFSSSC